MTMALYVGRVQHTRLQPVRHKLSYRVFMGLFDLDTLEETARRTWAFGYNRTALISFYDRDHGDGSGRPLRAQIEAQLREAGIATDGGAIRVLCMPRLLGYVFNPISVYFCYNKAGALSAVVHEVNNTFGGRHFYALPYTPNGRQACAKQFRVSPFLPMGMDYAFRLSPPDEVAAVSILVSAAQRPVLTASFRGARRPFSSGQILRLWLSHPALTFKVIVGIHWEALWLWLKLRKQKRVAAAATGAHGLRPL
jgi:DUF1365 family protein